MKVAGTCEAIWIPEKRCFYVKPIHSDTSLFSHFFNKKVEREGRWGKKFMVTTVLDLPFGHRSQKQLNTAWKLIDVLFQLQEEGFRKPTKEEQYSLYLDLLEEFAIKVVSRVNPNKLRPVHLSEANTFEAAHFIQAVFDQVADLIGSNCPLEADVRTLFFEWEQYRGSLENDPLDYQDAACLIPHTIKLWWERHPVSEATGVGGDLQRAHIVSRGSDKEDIEEPWNWMAILPTEHELQHKKGWTYFLQQYPHLTGRVERARELAKKFPLEMRNSPSLIAVGSDSIQEGFPDEL